MTDRQRDDDDRPDEVDADHETVPTRAEGRPATPVTQQLGRIVVLILLVVFIVFAVSNSQPVDFSWVVGSSEVVEDTASGETTGGVPLIVLLLAAFVIGALTGAMALRIVKRRRARAAAESER